MTILDLTVPPEQQWVKVATFNPDGVCDGYLEGFENAVALTMASKPGYTSLPWRLQWQAPAYVPNYSELVG